LQEKKIFVLWTGRTFCCKDFSEINSFLVCYYKIDPVSRGFSECSAAGKIRTTQVEGKYTGCGV
jgi:hypothetical protein